MGTTAEARLHFTGRDTMTPMKMTASKALLSTTIALLSVVVMGLLPDQWDKSLSSYQASVESSTRSLATATSTVSGDPALRNPFFARLASQYGSAWEKDVHPSLVRWVAWQRIVGNHAIITGIGGVDEDGTPHAGLSEIMIAVTEWDGTDLFSFGLPSEYRGIPIKIVKMGFAAIL